MTSRFISAAVFILLTALPYALRAQKAQEDPVLFSIDGEDIHLSEFTYVYEKSNGEEADFSEKSVEEFLDLYQKFKLKVADARAQGLDSDAQLEAELARYREQLADKYMSDEAVLERLTKELYNRMKWDIDVSHILRLVPDNATPYVEEQALADLREARKDLESGAEFSAVAKKYSQDRSVMENGGHLGYRRAKLPNGFYELETAIYTTSDGEIAGPIPSRLGYHLIKVNGRRPDPGTMEIAHILIREPNRGEVDTARQTIDHVYEMLKAGADFGEMALKYSEDNNNRRQNGYLGKFKTGTYVPAFEEAAFNISKDGGYSPPVHTEFGWHIIQRISLDTMGDYESEIGYLEDLVRDDDRYELAQEALIDRIREEENFHRLDVSNDTLLKVLTADVFQVDWKAPHSFQNRDLFQIRDSTYDLKGFLNFLARNVDVRYQRSMVEDAAEEVGNILNRYIDYEILEFEKAHLEEKYPEFREIMREYREGIMLFEISKEKIWDRAGNDTAGLKSFYDQHKKDYNTPRTIQFDEFTVNTVNDDVLDKVGKLIKRKKPEKVVKRLNKASEVIRYETNSAKEEAFADKFGTEISQLAKDAIFHISDKSSGTTIFGHIREIQPGNPLEFDDARGAVMSDYQKYLEDQWVEQLQNKYVIELNESVLQSIIRS